MQQAGLAGRRHSIYVPTSWGIQLYQDLAATYTLAALRHPMMVLA